MLKKYINSDVSNLQNVSEMNTLLSDSLDEIASNSNDQSLFISIL